MRRQSKEHRPKRQAHGAAGVQRFVAISESVRSAVAAPGAWQADHLALALYGCRSTQHAEHFIGLGQLLLQFVLVAPQMLAACAGLLGFLGQGFEAQHVGFQHLLVFQGVLHQRHQGIAGPLLGFLAQALVQADDFLHQCGEKAPAQGGLVAKQGLQVQAEAVSLALQLLQLTQWALSCSVAGLPGKAFIATCT